MVPDYIPAFDNYVEKKVVKVSVILIISNHQQTGLDASLHRRLYQI